MSTYSDMEDRDRILNRVEYNNIPPFLHSEKVVRPKYVQDDLDYTNIDYQNFDVIPGSPALQENLTTSGSITFDNSGNIFNMRIDQETIYDIVEAAHLYLFIWFLAIYVIVFYIIGFFIRQEEETYLDYAYSYFAGKTIIDKTLVGIFDFLLFVTILFGLVYLYITASVNTRINPIPALWEWSWEYFEDTTNFFGILLFTLIFYILVYALNIPMTKEVRSYFVHMVDVKIWSIIAFFLIILLLKYILGIDIPAYFLGKNFITDLWALPTTPTPSTKPNQTTIPLQTTTPIVTGNIFTKLNTITYGNGFPNTNTINNTTTTNTVTTDKNTTASSTTKNTTAKNTTAKNTRNEVFNIGNNIYNYDDAQMVCTAHGARLATYDEIEDAYNNGGEWCNYGWSDGQMIFFPTQKSTWDQLQKNTKQKNKCGRPGVNGGYMENPQLRFGVNCYGKRPDPKPEELARMNTTPPKTQEEKEFENKINFWKENADKLLQINGFNNNNWSQF